MTRKKASPKKVKRPRFSAERKTRIVLEGLSGQHSIAALCRREGISRYTYNKWSKAFLDAGTARLAEDDEPRKAEKSHGELIGFLNGMINAFPVEMLVSRMEDGEVLFRSQASERLYGGRSHATQHWVNDEDRGPYIEQLKRNGRVDDMYMFARRADGSPFPAQISARVVDNDGDPLIISSTTDLTYSRLRDAIEALGEGFVLYDKDECFVMANGHYREAFAPYQHLMKPGTPRADIIGPAMADGYAKVTTMAGRKIEDILRTLPVGESAKLELRLANGTQKIVTHSRLGDGGLAVTLVDITDRREVEERAREMMNDIIQSLDEGLSLYDSDLKFVMRNSRRYEMLSEQDHDIDVGRSLADVTLHLAQSGRILLTDGETPQEWSDRIVRQTKAYEKNIEIPGTDGHLYVLSVHKTGLGGYLLIFKDITEQRHAEQAQREADTLLRKIVEACPTTFLVSRIEDGKIIYFPEASRDRFGNIETTLEFFLDPEDRKDYLAALLPTGVLDDYPVTFRRANNEIMHGLTSARVTDYNGEDVIVSSTRDITDQLAMQAELERQREIAHQNEKISAMGGLLAGVAHELNNPLSIVVGYALMLQDKVKDPVQKRQVERIGQSAERCAKIVKTFLAMARQRPARIEVCSLNEIIETAMDVAGYGLRTSGARIKQKLGSSLPPVAVDPDQMAQVFSNLIVNAEHALSGHGKKARLDLITCYDKKSGEVVAEVRDNGDGVPTDIQARIFEPFFTTKDVGSGTGVGLAFSHRIVDSHGGTLTVKSSPGKGATFIVRLKAADRTAKRAQTVTGARSGQRDRRVLVVDDEAGVTEMIREILEDAGYRVDVENEPRAALARLKGNAFDAILSDMKMPGLDGEAFLKGIEAASCEHVERTAFITGDTMSPRVADFLKSTSAPYLEKPIAPQELIDLVDRLCARAEVHAK